MKNQTLQSAWNDFQKRFSSATYRGMETHDNVLSNVLVLTDV